jgi:hypothetical protein
VDKVIRITNLDGISMHNLRIREYEKNLARHKGQREDDCA